MELWDIKQGIVTLSDSSMTSKIDIMTSEGVLENIMIEKDYLDIRITDVRKKVNQSDFKGADIKGWHLTKPKAYKWNL